MPINSVTERACFIFTGQRFGDFPNFNSNTGVITDTPASHVPQRQHHHHHPPHVGHKMQQQQQQHNHSNKLSMPATTVTGASQRKSHNSTSSPCPDQTDFSSEEGSYTGSTCSTMNATSTTTTTNNSNTISRGGSGSGRFSHLHHHNHIQQPQQQSSTSTSPDVAALGRINSQRVVLRRSDNAASTMSRAKNRTLVMTIVITVVFVLCWTPYVVMTLW